MTGETGLGGDLRIMEAVERGRPFAMVVDGDVIRAFPGETVAAALLAAGRYTLRYTTGGSPRGLFCGIGYCHECRMTIDGRPNVRACITAALPDRRIVIRAQKSTSTTRE